MNSAQLEALLDGPALAPPPGHKGNLIDPPKRVLESYLVTSLCLFVTTLAVGLRMYTRVRITKQVTCADYTLLLGWALFVCFAAMAYLALPYDPGLHQWDISLRDMREFLYWYRIAAVEYGLIICCVKCSILVQYIQIFMPTAKPRALYWTTVFLFVANILCYVLITFLEIFACSPIAKSWDPLITDGYCVVDLRVLNAAATAHNSGSDFIILAIPHLIIWRLNMTWRKKLNLSIVFMVAILAIVFSVVRLHYSVKLAITTDVSYYSWLAGVWAFAEITFGILVAAIPAWGPFFLEFSRGNLYKAVSSFLQRMATRTATRARTWSKHKGNTSIESHEMGAWPPANARFGGMTLIHATHDDRAMAGSTEGLRVHTTIETSIEQARPWYEDVEHLRG